ncbi:MAG: glycosyltransferase family 39 protein [Rhodocyclaceae bacterium]|nr:glycosyltransferase family 39 protein [Rhodocyclaceae bacterium]
MNSAGMNPRRLFFVLLWLTLAFRFWLAQAMPITGDEAYFIDWGRNPDWGFYDHPPMIGWWLAALLKVSDAAWWLRLPVTVQPALLALTVAWAMARLWPQLEDDRCWWAALLVLLAPVNVWNVFVTTDTPLIYFAVFSGLAWIKAVEDDALGWYVAAGLLLAGAVLSKYFAALLGFAYLVEAALRRTPRAWAGLAVVYALCVPALLLMGWWNAGHCWPNYMFNFVNRHEDAGLSWRTPLLYGVTLAYVLSPPVLWLLVVRGGGVLTGGCRALATLSLVPFALFAALSLVKTIGLHWLLAFVPFALMPLARRLPLASLRRLGLFFVGVAVLHIAAIAVIARLPLETWQATRWYDGIVLTFDTQAMLEELKPYAGDYAFASDGYSNAVTFGYNARRRFIVFGEGSSHARHDDILTDFRALDGRNILVLRKSEPDAAWYRRYFREVEVKPFTRRGARFWIVLGRGFAYPAYRDEVLAKVRDKYYALPAWLPQTGCYFCDRYFPGTVCAK